MLGRLTANQGSWMSAVAGATGGATFDVGGVTCIHQPLPHHELLVPFPERSPGRDVLDCARELGARRVGCWLATPAPVIEETLRELGFAPGWSPHWMAAAAISSEPDPRVRETREVPEYDNYGEKLLALTRDEPQQSHLFVAREQGRFAGHAWLHVASGVGGLFDVFVFEEFRRRGLGSALTQAASAKAAERGLDTVTLNAEVAPLYESLGFRSLGNGQTWWRHGP